MKVGDLVTINFRFTPTQGNYNRFLENRNFVITEDIPQLTSTKSSGIFRLEPADGRSPGEDLIYVFMAKYLDLLEEQELCQALNSVGLL